MKRWTRRVNIFEKDFVVVPINENFHWFLVIICFPGQVGEGCRTVEDGAPCPTPARQRNRRRAKNKIKVGGEYRGTFLAFRLFFVLFIRIIFHS